MSDSTSDSEEPNPEGELPAHLFGKLRISIPGFKLESVIARGGQGIVFKGIQLSTGQLVAIKLLREGRLANPAARERLLREVTALATLIHPNIVRIIDRVTTREGDDCIVMNFISGKSLREVLDQRELGLDDQELVHTDELATLLTLFSKICQAIDFAHQQGFIHRDLCPSNILIDKLGEPQILDFGLARIPFDHELTDRDARLTKTGDFFGRLEYASPEQLRRDSTQISNATDVYALGVILYEILTGERPYKVDGDFEKALENILYTDPTPPSELIAARDDQRANAGDVFERQHSEVNRALETIVLKALAKNPAGRYQSANEMAEDIERYLVGQPTVARLSKLQSATQPISRRIKVGKRRAWIAGAVILCGLGSRLVHWMNDNWSSSAPVAVRAEPGAAALSSVDDLSKSPSTSVVDAPSEVQQAEPAEPLDVLSRGSVWNAYGRNGGLTKLVVLSRDGEGFTGRLTLPGRNGSGDFFVEGTIRKKNIHWSCTYSSLSEYAGTIEGDELAMQPIRFYENRGPARFRREE